MTSLTRLEQRATEVNIGASEPKTRVKMSNHALPGYARIMLALSATPPAIPTVNEIRPWKLQIISKSCSQGIHWTLCHRRYAIS